jgi:hypothetical protein
MFFQAEENHQIPSMLTGEEMSLVRADQPGNALSERNGIE